MRNYIVATINLTILIIVFLCASLADAQWMYKEKAQFTWTNDSPGEIEYKIYIAPWHKYKPTLIGRTAAKSFTYKPFVPGYWVFGVIPVKVADGSEADICWSDDSNCTLDNKAFRIRVVKYKNIYTIWKIMWK